MRRTPYRRRWSARGSGLDAIRWTADSIRPWLYKIATNRCLTLIETPGRRELPAPSPGAPLSRGPWLEPYPDARLVDCVAEPDRRVLALESWSWRLSLSLQHLSGAATGGAAAARGAGFTAAEVADLLDTSVAAVNSGLQRARGPRGELGAEPAGHAARAAREPGQRELVRRYMAAWEPRDVDAIVAMLAEDAKYSMPPLPEWYRGRAAIRSFLLDGPLQDGVALSAGPGERSARVRYVPVGRG